MGDFVGTIVDISSRLWATMPDIRNLKKNLKSLEVAVERLKQVYGDVMERVEREEKLRRKRKRTNEVAGWLHRVESMEADVSEILQEGKEKEQKGNLFGFFEMNFRSRYKFGERVSKMLNEVNELRTEGCFNVVAKVVRAPANEKPMEKTVALELKVEEVWRCIEDTDLQTIGLYGLGGVGKTTLLTKINNEFLNRSHGFEAVIWVSVSKEPDLKKMQEAILRELQIPDRIWKYERRERRAETVYGILKEKKFVLLLDDIWKRVNLVELGVLNHDQDMQKGSKVVFTTRSLEICGFMDAQRTIPVGCLTPEAALNLFRMKVGEDTLNSHPLISNLAETMAAECNGLPLALVTVGRAMASRKNPEEWEQAISMLRSSPSQLPGMNDVLLLLKFSFDRLQNTTLKSCFLYCCIFPEDYSIRKEELIELWLGEGFLDEFEDCYVDEFGGLSNVRRKGEYIIGSLKLACLLESSGESEEFVRMHQMIRDMALWECRDRIKIYVRRGVWSTQAYGSRSWNETERISLWDYTEDIFGDRNVKDSRLPNVRTLIYKAPMLSSFPAGILPLMFALTVLDLSNNFLLRGLPMEIGTLINLQYLNLSETAISKLPTELRNLTKLRCLLLASQFHKGNDRKEILTTLKKMILNFQLLEVFSITFCDEYLLYVLEHLQHISEISITNFDASLPRLLGSPKLLQCLKQFCLGHQNDERSIEVSPSLLRRMEHLELNSEFLKVFKISPKIGSIRHHFFDSLCRVAIRKCQTSDAAWLIYAPRLQHLTLISCRSMEEVIGGTSGVANIEENVGLFPSLTTLHLEDLPKLKGICPHALPFPLLMKIQVRGCSSLKKLPFDSNSAKNCLKQIYGERSWWDELQWEDEVIKQVFCSKFVENPDHFTSNGRED